MSEHYPSLIFQSRQFLNYEKSSVIRPPFVMDVFLLDVMAEMLANPLYFLSYINKRTSYIEEFLSSSEITILSFHLKNNLYLEDDINLVALDESIVYDLDSALYVRKMISW
ncbi:hypothetical protein [Francisella orientalis]|uniref:hypothetical protein n=1 Tax=Francisella orientalis TaxID=299583 RepID=UPI0011ECC1BD|nr:hypothetical protein [Francisella orientalis]